MQENINRMNIIFIKLFIFSINRVLLLVGSMHAWLSITDKEFSVKEAKIDAVISDTLFWGSTGQ